MAAFECNQLVKNYGGLLALNRTSFSLEAGQIVGLLGPNGSGKTTLIKIAAGLLQPTDGEILINGRAPGVETKSQVAYLPDRNFLPEYMNVWQILDFYGDFYEDFRREMAIEMLNSLGIEMKMTFKRMSKGTKEKVQLVLTMSREAEVYLLDEPIAGVDPATRDFILRTIINNYSENALVIISTHLIQDVEAVLDDVLFLQHGEIVLHKKTDDIREDEGKSVDALFREVFKC